MQTHISRLFIVGLFCTRTIALNEGFISSMPFIFFSFAAIH